MRDCNGMLVTSNPCCRCFHSCQLKSSLLANLHSIPSSLRLGQDRTPILVHKRKSIPPAYASAETEEEVQIEGIQRTYCDDFVCTSSPQIEQNVKALARDVTRLSTWTSSLFRKDVLYKDAFLSFRGIDKHKRITFPKDCIGQPKVLVTRLVMLDKGSCEVHWRLRGNIAVFPIDIDLVSTFGLDLITGRVNSHRDDWDLSRLSIPAKAAFLASRAAWSLQLSAENTKDSSLELLERFGPKGGDQQSNITADPNDPTKFFQDNTDPSKDLFTIGLIIAFIYLIYQAFSEIEKLR